MKLLKNNQNLFMEISNEHQLYNNLILDKYMNKIKKVNLQLRNKIFSTFNSVETISMNKYANGDQRITNIYCNFIYNPINNMFTSFKQKKYNISYSTLIRKIFRYIDGKYNSSDINLIYNLKNKYTASVNFINGKIKYNIDNFDITYYIGINDHNKVIQLNKTTIIEQDNNTIYFKIFDESSYKFHIIKEITLDDLILSLGKEYNGNIIVYGNDYISEIKILNNRYILEYENEYIDDYNLNLVLKNCTNIFNKQYTGNLNIEIMSNNAIFTSTNTNKIVVNYNKNLNLPIVRNNNNKEIVTYKITII